MCASSVFNLPPFLPPSLPPFLPFSLLSSPSSVPFPLSPQTTVVRQAACFDGEVSYMYFNILILFMCTQLDCFVLNFKFSQCMIDEVL